MGGFVVYMVRRVMAEMLTAKGTTMLGGVIIPVVLLILQFMVKFIRNGKTAFNKDDAIASSIAIGSTWLLLFSFFLFWRVPEEIRAEADTASISPFPAPRIPKGALQRAVIDSLDLSEDKKKQLWSYLATYRGQQVQVECATGHDRQCYYADEFTKIFTKAGWVAGPGLPQVTTSACGGVQIAVVPKQIGGQLDAADVTAGTEALAVKLGEWGIIVQRARMSNMANNSPTKPFYFIICRDAGPRAILPAELPR